MTDWRYGAAVRGTRAAWAAEVGASSRKRRPEGSPPAQKMALPRIQDSRIARSPASSPVVKGGITPPQDPA